MISWHPLKFRSTPVRHVEHSKPQRGAYDCKIERLHLFTPHFHNEGPSISLCSPATSSRPRRQKTNRRIRKGQCEIIPHKARRRQVQRTHKGTKRLCFHHFVDGIGAEIWMRSLPGLPPRVAIVGPELAEGRQGRIVEDCLCYLGLCGWKGDISIRMPVDSENDYASCLTDCIVATPTCACVTTLPPNQRTKRKG